MVARIGVRAEDKNRWERRAPVTPDHVRQLVTDHGVRVRIEPSRLRAFPEVDYQAAGAEVGGDICGCDVILGVKEIPPDKLCAGKTYVFFSHTSKGQQASMPMLERLLELGCTLLDYEHICDRSGRRLVFFGRHAGYAGMIDTLWALGQRLAWEGFDTPLEDVRLAHQYLDLSEATSHLGRIGETIRHLGLPAGLRPVVTAFTGSGNVSRGAQEIYDRLPVQELVPDELRTISEDTDRPRSVLYKVVLGRADRVRRIAGGEFDAAEYGVHPERYEGALGELLPRITVLVNGIYWTPERPRLVRNRDLHALWTTEEQPKLRVIGDITCDVGGSVEANVRSTTPGAPTYVFEPRSGSTRDGIAGRGPVILAVDNLPCELPIESSEHFGDSLLRFLPPLCRCDWSVPYEALALPPELHRAVIVHRGRLAPPFAYLGEALGGSPAPGSERR